MSECAAPPSSRTRELSVRVKNYDETLRTTARQTAVEKVDGIEILLRFHLHPLNITTHHIQNYFSVG